MVSATLRFDEGLAERLGARAEERGCSRNELIVELCERGLETGHLDALLLSVSQLACLDQLAARAGVTRVELMRRYLGERLRREFVDARNARLQDVSRA